MDLKLGHLSCSLYSVYFYGFSLGSSSWISDKKLFVLWCMAPVKFNCVSFLYLQVKEES